VLHRPEGVTIIAMWSFLCASVCVLFLGGLSIGLLGLWISGDPKNMMLGTVGLLLGARRFRHRHRIHRHRMGAVVQELARGAAIVLAVLQIVLIPIGPSPNRHPRLSPAESRSQKAFGLPVTEPH
jgi:hypothetical protein